MLQLYSHKWLSYMFIIESLLQICQQRQIQLVHVASQVLGSHSGGGAVLGRHAEVPHQEGKGPESKIGSFYSDSNQL